MGWRVFNWGRQLSSFSGGGGLARGLYRPPPPPAVESLPTPLAYQSVCPKSVWWAEALHRHANTSESPLTTPILRTGRVRSSSGHGHGVFPSRFPRWSSHTFAPRVYPRMHSTLYRMCLQSRTGVYRQETWHTLEDRWVRGCGVRRGQPVDTGTAFGTASRWAVHRRGSGGYTSRGVPLRLRSVPVSAAGRKCAPFEGGIHSEVGRRWGGGGGGGGGGCPGMH